MLLATLPHVLARTHGFTVSWSFSVSAVVALAAGLLILIRPKLLNFIVAAYLIFIGLMGLVHLRW